MNEDPASSPPNSFPKEMRITRKSQMDELFSSGESFIAYPLRVVFVKKEKMPESEIAVLVNVSKRKFKRAVKRNRMKRLIRENFRIHRHDLENLLRTRPYSLNIAFLYLKNELSDYVEINKAMAKALDLLKKKIPEV